jgi:hypothetical protein
MPMLVAEPREQLWLELDFVPPSVVVLALGAVVARAAERESQADFALVAAGLILPGAAAPAGYAATVPRTGCRLNPELHYVVDRATGEASLYHRYPKSRRDYLN